MLSKEEIEKAKSNLLRGNDIESACLIMEEIIWNDLVIAGGRVNIVKIAMRQILNFVQEYKDKGYIDIIREKVQIKERNKELEQENNKQNKGSFEFEISEESAKKLHKMFEPLENSYNRFENGKETLDDLLNYYPNFRIQIKNNGKQEELDLVEKKYYEKLVDTVNKQNKIIDEMALAIASYDIDEEICKNQVTPLCDKNSLEVTADICVKCLKQYFEKKVEEK